MTGRGDAHQPRTIEQKLNIQLRPLSVELERKAEDPEAAMGDVSWDAFNFLVSFELRFLIY